MLDHEGVPCFLEANHADKIQIIRAADPDALALSFSCLDPRGDLHCGACYKCGRRKAAFHDASVKDPTIYAEP
jgi:7-cyano-7-deazaguanine synthase